MTARAKETTIAVAGVAIVVAVIAGVLVWFGDVGDKPASSEPAPTAEPTTSSAKPKPKPVTKLPAALAVKVDNVPQARPHTGLSTADAIYVEPVEGGFTRLLAVYWGKRPPVIGPVRSARESDVELLGYLDRPVLAYSGAATRLDPILRASELVRATPDSAGSAFYRSGVKPIPHNLYLDPSRVPNTKAVDSPLTTGRAPSGGRRVRSHEVEFQNASYEFAWSPVNQRWQVSADGAPLTSTESGQLGAGTVVVQRVETVVGAGVKDRAGSRSPVVRTVGSGDAIMLRGGRRYDGTWSRASTARETTYRTDDGDPLPLGPGPVWVLLVPA